MNAPLTVSSGVSLRHGGAFLTLHWGDSIGQFTPDEARAFASQIFDAAAAAEFDEAIVSFLAPDVRWPITIEEATKLEPNPWAMLQAIRQHRGGGTDGAFRATVHPDDPEVS